MHYTDMHHKLLYLILDVYYITLFTLKAHDNVKYVYYEINIIFQVTI